jgi:ribosomal protein S12 methylthiotransferase
MRYGTDFSSSSQLLPLLHELDKLPYDFKYRILYLYPDILTLKQLEEFASLEKFKPYFDIPLQHISPKLLKSMGRFYDDKMIHTLLK